MKQLQKRPLPAWISRVGLAGLTGLVMTGCASQSPALLPDGGPTTKDVYEQHVAGGYATSVSDVGDHAWQATLQQARPESTWSRSAQQNLDADFQRLPNPELTGYVFPHFTRQGTPVPGYMTRFPLYEKNAYALPGEIPVPRPATTPRLEETHP